MQTSPRSRILSVSQKLYQISLFAYPAEYRREYGPLMAQLFRDLCRAGLLFAVDQPAAAACSSRFSAGPA